jgi:hypothetical protein
MTAQVIKSFTRMRSNLGAEYYSFAESTSSLALRATAFGGFGLDLAAPNEELATIASMVKTVPAAS